MTTERDKPFPFGTYHAPGHSPTPAVACRCAPRDALANLVECHLVECRDAGQACGDYRWADAWAFARAALAAPAAQPAEPTQSTMSSDMASQAQEILRDAERNRYREQPAEPPAPDDLVDDALSWGALWRECNRWKEDSQAQAKTIARLGATAEDRNVVDQLRHDAYERDIAALRAENERQAREIAEHKRDREARNKIDPVTRLHNLCDGLAEHRRESPYDEESWRLADESYQKKCKELTALQAKVTQANRIIAAADAYFDYLHSPAMWEGFNAERLRNEYRAERAEWKP